MRVCKCPKCGGEVQESATACPGCRVELAQCSWCRDLTSLLRVERAGGRARRVRYRCDRCDRLGVKCRTALLGSYCNGLARAEGSGSKQLCARCTSTLLDAGKTVALWTVIGFVGSRIRPKG